MGLEMTSRKEEKFKTKMQIKTYLIESTNKNMEINININSEIHIQIWTPNFQLIH